MDEGGPENGRNHGNDIGDHPGDPDGRDHWRADEKHYQILTPRMPHGAGSPFLFFFSLL